MSQFSGPIEGDPGIVESTPQRTNAVLFHQLAQFLVWGQEHSDVAAVHSDLGKLLQATAFALNKAGVLEHPASSDIQDQSDKTRREF